MLLFALVMVGEGFSQTYYNWDFTTLPSNTLPAGFVTWKLDGQTASTTDWTSAGQTLFNAAGWVVAPAGALSSTRVAATTSDFNNAVAADRWLVTPRINLPAATPNVVLQWEATSLDGNYPDSYEILVSTTDSATTSFSTIIYSGTESGSFTTHVLPIAAYGGQTIRIAFRDTTTSGLALLLNSIKVVNLPSNQASMYDVEIYEHNYLTQPVVVNGYFQNTGFDTLNSFTLNYSVNGGAPVTSPVSQLGLPSQQYSSYSHPTLFNPTTAGTYTVSVWLSALNGSGANSDTISSTIFFYPKVGGLKKNVLVEEFTGAWCGYCPGGAFYIRDLLAAEPYTVAVAIHDQNGGTTADDAMQIPAGDQLNQTYGTGFPDAMVDRVFYFDNQATGIGFYTYTNSPFNIHDTLAAFRYNQATPANVSLSAITFDSTASTNNLTVTVNSTFLNSLSQGDYRLNLIVAEDSIITTGAGYDQHNYYSSAMYGSNAQDAGNSPLNALAGVITNDGQPNDWAQNHVLRAMAGGAWGQGGDIPSAPAASSTYSHTFTTTIPTSWRYKFIKLIGVVQEYNADTKNRYVLNVTEVPLLGYPAGISENSQFNKLSVYPNPASTMATLLLDSKENGLVRVSVLDALGQVVIEPSDVLLNKGSQSVKIPVSNLSAGLYFVKVTFNGGVSTLPLSITAK